MKYFIIFLVISLFNIKAYALDFSDKEIDIIKYTFNYLISTSTKALSTKKPDFFSLSIFNLDPDQKIMNFLCLKNTKLVPLSVKINSVNSKNIFIDCKILSIKLINENTAIVKVYFGDIYSGKEEILKLKMINNKWNLIKKYNIIEYD